MDGKEMVESSLNNSWAGPLAKLAGVPVEPHTGTNKAKVKVKVKLLVRAWALPAMAGTRNA